MGNTTSDPNASTTQNRRRGAVYVAFGYEHLIMAANSARSLREVHPEFGIVLITNIPVGELVYGQVALFDEIRYVAEDATANRDYKLDVATLSPFEDTVFLDADTEIWGRLDDVFALLTIYDLAVHIEPYITSYDLSGSPVSFEGLSRIRVVSWNSGVLFWRSSPKMQSFFADWHRHYLQRFERGSSGSDQPSLGATIFARPDIRVFNLRGAWNATPSREAEKDFIAKRPEMVKILHYRQPRKWPPVGRRLAVLYRKLRIQWLDGEPYPADEVSRYETLLKAYGSPLYQYRQGRRVLWKWYALRARLSGNPRLRLRRLSQRRGRVR